MPVVFENDYRFVNGFIARFYPVVERSLGGERTHFHCTGNSPPCRRAASSLLTSSVAAYRKKRFSPFENDLQR